MQSSILGYKSIVITNNKCSKEKIDALKAYGAKVLLCPSGVSIDDPQHYQNVELELCNKYEDYFSINQYDNMLNPDAYYQTLGPELVNQMVDNDKIDYFIAAASTGGTLSGTGKYLKEHHNANIINVMPDPYGSIFYDFWKEGIISDVGKFQVEGVGKDSIPKAMNFNIVDQVPRFTDAQAFDMCHQLAIQEGLMVGGSAGANVWAGVEIAKKNETKNNYCMYFM